MALTNQVTPEGYDGLACVYTMAGQTEKANDLFHAIGEWFPTYQPAKSHYAYLLDKVGQKKGAIRAYNAALLEDPLDFESRNNIGAVMYDLKGNYSIKEAKQYIEEALVVQNDPRIRKNLIALEKEKGRDE